MAEMLKSRLEASELAKVHDLRPKKVAVQLLTCYVLPH
jgi:hypothetical protein